jgi:alpha-tubulin suppressor-like RCC1 family protein
MKKNKLITGLGLLFIASSLISNNSRFTAQANGTGIPSGFNLFSYSYTHSMVYTTEGKLFAMGRSSNWALLGREDRLINTTDRTSVLGLQVGETVTDVEVGNETNMFLTSNGRLLTSGYNKQGQIGNDTVDQYWGKDIPVAINLGLSGEETITNITSSYSQPVINAAVTSTGRVMVWGSNPVAVGVDAGFDDYAFHVGKNPSGRTDVELFKTPYDVTSVFTTASADKITDVFFRSTGGLALTTEQSVLTWGKNTKGLLGNNQSDETVLSGPLKIDLSTVLNAGELISQAIVTDTNVFLRTSGNRILLWGDNEGQRMVTDGDAVISVPTIYDLTGVTLSENETLTDMIQVDWGIMLLTSDGEIWFKGYTPVSSIARTLLVNAEELTAYRADLTWINQTQELPIFNPTEKVINIEGFGSSYLFITNEGRLATQYYFGTPDSITFGSKSDFLSARFNDAIYRIFIGESTESILEVADGESFTLPSQSGSAPSGYYFAGWAMERNATQANFAANYSFTMNYDSHFRFFPVFLEGNDPNASSSSSANSSSSQTTSNPNSSTNINPSNPGSSGDVVGPTPRTNVLGAVLLTTVVGGAAVFSWMFFARGLTIGGFSFVVLKKWFFAFIKRNKKDKDEDKK